MINQSSNQTSGTLPKVLSTSSTFIPEEYTNSTEGFNSWTAHIKNQVHEQYMPADKHTAYQNLFKNVFRR